MADQQISINIGTSYNNQGMQKAMSATDQLSKVAGRTSGAIGSLGSALGGLDGKVGQAVGAFSKLTGALAVGGPVGLAIAGITSLIAVFSQMSAEAEKAKKAQEKAFSDKLIKGVDEYGKNLDTVIGKLDKLSQAQHKAAQSTIALNGAMTDKSIAQRQLDAINESADADEGERGIVNAQAQIDIAKMKGKNAVEAADINAEDARQRVGATGQALGTVDTEIRQLRNHIGTLDSLTRAYQDSAQKSEYKDQGAVSKAHASYTALQKAQQKLAQLEEKRAGLAEQLKNQSREMYAAEEKAQTARINAEAENAKANAALKDAEEKAWEAEEKARQQSVKESMDAAAVEAQREIEAKKEAEAEKKLREAIDEDSAAREDLRIATKELEDAQKEYADKLKRAEVAPVNSTWQGWSGTNGIPLDQITNNGINRQNRYGPRNNASPRDKAYWERVAAGMERNAQSQGYGLTSQQRRRQRELEEKARRGTALSDKELAELREINDADPKKRAAKAAREAADAAKKVKEKQEAKERAEKELQRNVAKIVQYMNQLGLK